MRNLFATTALTLTLAACSGSSETKSETAAPAQKDDGAKDEAKAEGGDEKDAKAEKKVKVVDGKAPAGDDRYALEFDTPQAESGKESTVTVRVVPKSPWHMNLEYPTALKVEAPEGVSVAKADMKKADAKLDEDGCQFDVSFTPSAAGEQTFTGEFKFAVCQDEACSPVKEDIQFKVAVK